MNRCIYCGRRVYLVQDLHGFQFYVVSAVDFNGYAQDPWGQAICDHLKERR